MNYSSVFGIEISKICFGCEALGGSSDCGTSSVADIEAAIHRALDLGINFFDTADVYGLGMSEERLSRILSEKRHQMNIATKVGVAWESKQNERAKTWKDSSPIYLRKAVEASLSRLRIDRIPILYSHWPDPATDISKTFEVFARLKEEGKLHLLGCSNYELPALKKIIQIVPIAFLQLPLNILTGKLDDELIRFCKDNKIGIVTYNTLANGLLTGKFTLENKPEINDRRNRLPLFQSDRYLETLSLVGNLTCLAEQEKLTLPQYAIKWTLSQSQVVSAIVGIKSSVQLEANIMNLNL